MYITNRILFSIISVLLLVDSTKQSRVRFVKGVGMAISKTMKSPVFKTIGNTLKTPFFKLFGNTAKDSVRKFGRNKSAIKNCVFSLQDKYLKTMHTVGSNTIKYVGSGGIQKFKYVTPQAMRSTRQLFKAEIKKNLQRRSSTQLRKSEFRPILFKKSREWIQGKKLSSLVNMISESKPLLFATGGFAGLTHLNAFPNIEELNPDMQEAVLGQTNLKPEDVGVKNVVPSAQDIELGKEIVWDPKGEEHKHTQIFLPGLGGSAEGYKETFSDTNTPVDNSVKIRCLTAPSAPTTIAFGLPMNSWFDVKDLCGSPDFYSIKDAIKNSGLIKKVIEEEIEKLGGKSEKVFLGGFSQGAAMALHIALGYEKPLGGVVGLSGFKFRETEAHANNKDIPILLTHGTVDEVVPFEATKTQYELKDWLKSPNVKFHPIEGMNHAMDDKVMGLFKDFIKLHSK